MTTVSRASASFFFPFVVCFTFCGFDIVRIGTCRAEESPPLAELRAEEKAEWEAELLYLKKEIVSIAVRHAQPRDGLADGAVLKRDA